MKALRNYLNKIKPNLECLMCSMFNFQYSTENESIKKLSQ